MIGHEVARRIRPSFDPISAIVFVLGALALLRVSGLNFLRQDANWDLLNYHAYVPASLLDGRWFSDFHPAGLQTYLTPYQDLIQWPLVAAVPAPVATAVLVAIQLSIFVPVGLILEIAVPSLTRSRALALGLLSISGAMTVTELGSTMGDVPPAILVAWGLYLLLSTLTASGEASMSKSVVAGALIAAAVALKFTVAYVAPGLLVVALTLVYVGKRRNGLLFLGLAPVLAGVFYAPWAVVLLRQAGSPMFPLFNAVFRAPRYDLVDFQDTRFPVTSLADLIALPVRQAQGVAATSELQFTDVRWLLAFAAVLVAAAILAIRIRRRGGRYVEPGSRPAVVLVLFWCVSYALWARAFGVQRYAVLLEVLAVPVLTAGCCLVAPHLATSRATLPAVALLVALLAATTQPVDFGRRPMTESSLVPATTVEPLARYDAIVIASPPLAYLAAVSRDAPRAPRQTWLGTPFNEADRAVAISVLRGRSVGVVFYTFDRESAGAAAEELGLRLTDTCASFGAPVPSSLGLRTIDICMAIP